MAGTVSLIEQLAYTYGGVSFSRKLTKDVVVTGKQIMHAVQNIGTAEETLALGDVTPAGYAYFLNLDGTNYLELGKATGVYVLKLKAGEPALLRLDSWSTIYAKANTAAVDLEYLLLAD